MYRATTSFTTNDYDVRYRQILEDDFASQEEIDEFLRIGYIEVYDDTIDITENGIYDVEDYQNANVDVAGGGTANLQSKDVSISQNGTTTITADQGYDGLSDVDVTVSGVLDTSDATAVAGDMASGKTAYVNGQKISGNVFDYGTNAWIPQYPLTVNSLGAGQVSHVINFSNSSAMFRKGGLINVYTPFASAAIAIGLTANKLKKDEVVLGITGTYEGTKIVLPNYTRFTGSQCTNFDWIEDTDTSNLTNCNNMFASCNYFEEAPLMDTSNVISFADMFNNCSKLISVPAYNTGTGTDFRYMFIGSNKLENIPAFDFSKALYFESMFGYSYEGRGLSLTDTSLNNLLLSLSRATSYTGTKTLRYLGLHSTVATRCQSLSNWNAFVNAGWSTGY